jgi:HPr kinase/phosphorylase
LIPRIPVEAGFQPLPLVVAALTTTKSSPSGNNTADCVKGFGNHIRPTIATE